MSQRVMQKRDEFEIIGSANPDSLSSAMLLLLRVYFGAMIHHLAGLLWYPEQEMCDDET